MPLSAGRPLPLNGKPALGTSVSLSAKQLGFTLRLDPPDAVAVMLESGQRNCFQSSSSTIWIWLWLVNEA
jgi:hypothetical protein